jgi:hypothetical protein
MPNDKNMTGGDDEFVDASEIEFVRRGRVSNLDPELVAKLGRLPKGKAYPIKALALDPTSADYKTEKNRVSATIRNACRNAGLRDFSLRWSPQGVPQVVNTAK